MLPEAVLWDGSHFDLEHCLAQEGEEDVPPRVVQLAAMFYGSSSLDSFENVLSWRPSPYLIRGILGLHDGLREKVLPSV